ARPARADARGRNPCRGLARSPARGGRAPERALHLPALRRRPDDDPEGDAGPLAGRPARQTEGEPHRAVPPFLAPHSADEPERYRIGSSSAGAALRKPALAGSVRWRRRWSEASTSSPIVAQRAKAGSS